MIRWTLLVLGLLGLFLPFLQGALLLLAGVSLLSTEYNWAHKLLQRLRTPFPGLDGRLDRAETWIRDRLMRVFRKESSYSQD
jgi:uncharacterized protein